MRVNRGAWLAKLTVEQYQERLREQVLRHIKEVDGCWEWQAAVAWNGYGRARLYAKATGAHKVSYFAFKGEIGAGLVVMHSCNNRRCVNPSHLSLGTQKQNLAGVFKRGPSHHNYGRKGPMGSASKCSRPVEIDGVRYGAMNEAARELGVSIKTISNWIDRGRAMRLDEQEKAA